MGFTVKLVLMLAVVAGGTWVWVLVGPQTPSSQTQIASVASTQVEAVPKDITNSGNSDEALVSDIAQIDAEIAAAQESVSSADAFIDQPIEQTE